MLLLNYDSNTLQPLSSPYQVLTFPDRLSYVYGSSSITNTNTNTSFLTDMFIHASYVRQVYY